MSGCMFVRRAVARAAAAWVVVMIAAAAGSSVALASPEDPTTAPSVSSLTDPTIAPTPTPTAAPTAPTSAAGATETEAAPTSPTPTSVTSATPSASPSITVAPEPSAVASVSSSAEPRATATAQPDSEATPMAEIGQAGQRLGRGATLGPNAPLYSPDGRVQFVLQSDGNLVVYSKGLRPLWNSGTQGKGGNRLVMQGDGNLVLYTPTDRAVWESVTWGTDASTLVIQADGNLVIYGGSGATWSSGTRNDLLRVNQILTGGQGLASLDGRWSLELQVDGNLVVYQEGKPQWASSTFTPAPWLVLQGDGNLVMYNSANQPVWYTGRYGATTLSVDVGGAVMARSSTGSTVWSTYTGRSRLAVGWSIANGDAIPSPSGAFTLVMQADGNLVVYSSGVAQWSSATYGNPGATARLLGDGRLLIISVAGRVLWQSVPVQASAAWLQMQDDGNVVAYTEASAASWWSRGGRGVATDYPSQTSPPSISVSRYVRNLRSDSQDAPLMQGEGCADASRNPAGHQYLMLLAVGAQSSTINAQWGVRLTTTSIGITNASLVSAMTAYIDGYASCAVADAKATIAIGTNNDSSDAAARGAAGGTVFAREIINPLALHAARYPGVTVAGANDIEPSFKGSQDEALQWTAAYLNSTTAPFVFFGSADGCPAQRLGLINGACNNGYTQLGMYQLAFGLAPARSIAMPQIYFSPSMPNQWANISLTGVANSGPRIAFGGSLTEVRACQQAGNCDSLGSSEAWLALWATLNASPSTAIPSLPYSTDLRIDLRGQPTT